MGLFVNSAFDSGNVEVVSTRDPTSIQLRIHEDPFCEHDQRAHFQFFHFRLTGCRQQAVNMKLVNAGSASFPDAWRGYQACASYDRICWFRVPTSYDDAGILSIQHTPEKDACYYAYFAPYSYKRHQDLIAETLCHDQVRLFMIGETLDGHDMDLLQIGEPGQGKKKIWIIARQHPGESMAEWFAEGLLNRLHDQHDALSKKLLRDAVFYVIPNMNPDGTWRGHLRTNAAGANLNREWAHPTAEQSPEVFYTLQAMEKYGCDFMADIHGDEELPYVFINGNEGIPGWNDRLESLQSSFAEALQRASPDFQKDAKGYGIDKAGEANLNICGHAVGERFKCLSFTLEMPFKDTEHCPDDFQGWSPERSMRLGAAFLNAVADVCTLL
eukprot:jgi/Astpho2/9641/Aster-03910